MHKFSLKEHAKRKQRDATDDVDPSRVYMDLEVDGAAVGRVVVKLAEDVAPKTCKNFRMLCTGEMGQSSRGVQLTYEGSKVHRICKGFIIQGGDIVNGNGTGGECAVRYDPAGKAAVGSFDDETFALKHTKPGLVSMANRGPNTNNSQFFFTLASAPHLDGLNVCFGEVVKGLEVLMAVARLDVDEASGEPKAEVRVAGCGAMPRGDGDDGPDAAAALEAKARREREQVAQAGKRAQAAVMAALGGGGQAAPGRSPTPEPHSEGATPPPRKRGKPGKKKGGMLATAALDSDSDSGSSGGG